MYQLSKISTAIATIGLSTFIFMGQGCAAPSNSDSQNNYAQSNPIQNNYAQNNPTQNSNGQDDNQSNSPQDMSSADSSNDISPVSNGVSQQLDGNSEIAISLNKLLPTIKYTTENLPNVALKVNSATWSQRVALGGSADRNLATKLQALLNWQHHGVGAVDGYWGKNTLKAMQAFQKSQNLALSDSLNTETWQALTRNQALMTQPVLVSYQLTDADINIKTTQIPASAQAKSQLDGMYYESVLEALAEKFHMSKSYLKSLNPNASFSVGETITVYNPGDPNTKPVTRVVADKNTQTLYSYDDSGALVASYPTTVGSTSTPSPSGTHSVEVKVHEPNYTYTADDGSKSIIPPGPNNPVGLVWIGLSKPSYGIHGSPDPERISRQASAGCVRLTNWDALALLGAIQKGATVEFR